MKKSVLFCILFVLLSVNVFAQTCELAISLINQDPNPAVPTEAVDVLLQVTGVDSKDCGDLTFWGIESFPFTFDPASEKVFSFKSGTYTEDYSSFLMLPFKLRIDKNSLDGTSQFEVRYTFSNQVGGEYFSSKFDIDIEKVQADFEVFVENYDFNTNLVTLHILNSGKSNIEAVAVEVPKQDGVVVKGSNRNIIGDLDSNEDTTTDFELTSYNEEINLNFAYSDATGERRTTSTTVNFDPTYFQDRKADQKTSSPYKYPVVILIILVIGYWLYRRNKNKSKMN